MKLLAGFVVFAAAVVFSNVAMAQPQHVQAELLADTTAVQPGKPFTLALHLTVDDGWHVYWSNPGDAGAATTLKLDLPDGWTAGPVEYPVPEKLPQPGGLTIYAYEKELVLRTVVTPPAKLDAANIDLNAAARWCVCSDVCILGNAKLKLSLPVGAGDSNNAALFSAWESRFPVAQSAAFDSVNAQTTPDGSVDVQLKWQNDPPAGHYEWLPGACDDLTVSATNIRATGRTTEVTLKLQPVQGISPTSSAIDGVLAYYTADHAAGGASISLARAPLHVATAK